MRPSKPYEMDQLSIPIAGGGRLRCDVRLCSATFLGMLAKLEPGRRRERGSTLNDGDNSCTPLRSELNIYTVL